MKKCTMCKEDKTLEEYSLTKRYRKKTKDYAREAKCKECMREYTRKYKQKHYQANKERIKERSKRQREEDPEGMREYWRQYHLDNRERRLKGARLYQQTPQGKLVRDKAQENYRQRADYSFKQGARKKVFRAVKSGKLIKPNECENCRVDKFLEGHHEDYSKPLDVIWLCKTCHEKEHHLNEGSKPI